MTYVKTIDYLPDVKECSLIDIVRSYEHKDLFDKEDLPILDVSQLYEASHDRFEGNTKTILMESVVLPRNDVEFIDFTVVAFTEDRSGMLIVRTGALIEHIPYEQFDLYMDTNCHSVILATPVLLVQNNTAGAFYFYNPFQIYLCLDEHGFMMPNDYEHYSRLYWHYSDFHFDERYDGLMIVLQAVISSVIIGMNVMFNHDELIYSQIDENYFKVGMEPDLS